MQLAFRLRQIRHDVRVSLLFLPALVLGAHLAAGLILPWAEEALAAEPWMIRASLAVAVEPGTAQIVLTTVAGAIMTVVSVVYSVLLVALSLASMQFSTRILGHFLQDGPNRATLGMFVGTFAYCLVVLRSVRTAPPWVPAISVALALLLALACLGSLVLFIHRIATGIQANVLVDRIATEAEEVVRAVFPPQGVPPAASAAEPSEVELPKRAVLSQESGYVQIVDAPALRALARVHRTRVRLARANGAFVARGAVLAWVDVPEHDALDGALRDAVDIGPVRTMQDDAEFGLRQIVDIGLKALSPAVNDPSTAATCVDHLGRLLLEIARRAPPVTDFPEGVHVPNTSFRACVELAFDQLRQYGAGDMAVSLRILRVLAELARVARTTEDRAALLEQGEALHAAAAPRFLERDRRELERRWEELRETCGAEAP
jgi:uncharacterized membrane protein